VRDGLKFQRVIVKAGSISNHENTMIILSPLLGPSTCKLVVTKRKCSDILFGCVSLMSILRPSCNANISQFNDFVSSILFLACQITNAQEGITKTAESRKQEDL